MRGSWEPGPSLGDSQAQPAKLSSHSMTLASSNVTEDGNSTAVNCKRSALITLT